MLDLHPFSSHEVAYHAISSNFPLCGLIFCSDHTKVFFSSPLEFAPLDKSAEISGSEGEESSFCSMMCHLSSSFQSSEKTSLIVGSG